ncbi:MAG: hypothetical protein L3J82_08485 [Planctomycetes bacterium]|nr:hypothetical protein [Planctomycetota bacterium]
MKEIIEQLKAALPEDVRNTPEITAALEHIANADTRQKAEATFLKQAVREGMTHAEDALKLEDIPERLKGDDPKQAMSSLFEHFRETRPWLFAERKETPGNNKITSETVLEKTRRQWNGGGLTRQVLKFRRQK